MIDFRISRRELQELNESIPNLVVILEAMKKNPLINLIISEEQ